MKYAIFYIIEGKAKKYLQNLKAEISKNFKLPSVEYKSFPHITLKHDFEGKNIREIENLLEALCLKYSATEIKIKGVGTFNRKVIFLKVVKTKLLEEIYFGLFNALESVKWLSWESYEKGNFFPHITAAYRQLNEENFDQILEYIRNKRIGFDLSFDNIAITKVKKKARKIHKIYRL